MDNKIALGGNCHWCTEAIFRSLRGVSKVDQGWLAATADEHGSLSEGVIVYFDAQQISLANLIEIHLHTHSCTSNHKLRARYRSAVYAYSKEQREEAESVLFELQNGFDGKVLTQALLAKSFVMSREAIRDYYYSNPQKLFCQAQINPKLRLLLRRFNKYVDSKQKLIIENALTTS